MSAPRRRWPPGSGAACRRPRRSCGPHPAEDGGSMAARAFPGLARRFGLHAGQRAAVRETPARAAGLRPDRAAGRADAERHELSGTAPERGREGRAGPARRRRGREAEEPAQPLCLDRHGRQHRAGRGLPRRAVEARPERELGRGAHGHRGGDGRAARPRLPVRRHQLPVPHRLRRAGPAPAQDQGTLPDHGARLVHQLRGELHPGLSRCSPPARSATGSTPGRACRPPRSRRSR